MEDVYALQTLDGRLVLDMFNNTLTMSGEGGEVEGATATVDTAGEIDKRVTATRLALAGPLALAWQKREDNRELYILVEGSNYSMVARVDPKAGADARKFAAAINTAGKGGVVVPPILTQSGTRDERFAATHPELTQVRGKDWVKPKMSTASKVLIGIVVAGVLVFILKAVGVGGKGVDSSDPTRQFTPIVLPTDGEQITGALSYRWTQLYTSPGAQPSRYKIDVEKGWQHSRVSANVIAVYIADDVDFSYGDLGPVSLAIDCAASGRVLAAGTYVRNIGGPVQVTWSQYSETEAAC